MSVSVLGSVVGFQVGPLEEDATMTKKLKPMHPGEVLREEFLIPLKMSAGALAKACGLPRTRVERIANKRTGITGDTTLRLAKALGTAAQLWLNLQSAYDIQIAKRGLGKILDRIVTVNKPKAA
jgi:addiction module HigA family antidote